MSLIETRGHSQTGNHRVGRGALRIVPTQKPGGNVALPDGTSITSKKLHELRSSAHQKLPTREFSTCAARVRSSIGCSQWATIRDWLQLHMSGKGPIERRENVLIAALLCLAAERQSSAPAILFDRIIKKRNAKGILVAA